MNARIAPWTLYTNRQRWGLLSILFLVSTFNYVDRNILSVLLEPIKHEFKVSDSMLGLLGGICFAVFYAAAGVPVARWADRGNRRTIIALAITAWSLMTVFCGLAQTYWQLALARIGVGASESGSVPPAQSLIADYFPPQQRTTAIAFFGTAAIAGLLLGVGVGGYIAGTRGWRTAFLLAGAPGLVLAIIARFALAEPRLSWANPSASGDAETLREAALRLWRKRSFRHVVFGLILTFMFSYGVLIFIPSFLTRVLHGSLADVSATYASVSAGGSLLGTLVGGWLADYLGRRDFRWLAWVPAFGLALTGVSFLIALSVSHLWPFYLFAFVAWGLLSGGVPPVFAAVHAVCGNRRRATAVGIVLFSATLFGGGFGPLATGALSDVLSSVYGTAGLRYALMAMMPLMFASAMFLYACGRAMPRDLEDYDGKSGGSPDGRAIT